MRFISAFSFILFSSFATAAFAGPPPASFADLVDKLSPAVVNISTTQKVKGGVNVPGLQGGDLDSPEMEPFRDFMQRFGAPQAPGGKGQPVPDQEVTSLGSGFIIDANGFVITNNHVVGDADDITVTLSNNNKYKAKLIGTDKKTDLALLKIEGKNLPFVSLGDSDAMRVGDWVIAIGNPFGLGGSVTQGIISARQRSINSGPYDDFLQTDAPINRGNSGGPLFNMEGKVIGINTAIFSPSGGNIGIGFAIPTSLAGPVIEQLKQFGRTHRGWLGVKIQQVSDDLAESVGMKKVMGALVMDITKGGPADKAGLKAGDIITQFEGKDITEMRFLPRMVADAPIGKTASLTFWRKGASQTVKVNITELKDEDDKPVKAAAGKKDKAAGEVATTTVQGMELANLNEGLRQRFKLAAGVEGVLVVDVAQGSEAAKKGVRAGDVIAEVTSEGVKTPDEVRKAFETAKKNGRANTLLKIMRGGEVAFITLPSALK